MSIGRIDDQPCSPRRSKRRLKVEVAGSALRDAAKAALKLRQGHAALEQLLERGARLIDTEFAGQSRLQAELFGVVASIFVDTSNPRWQKRMPRSNAALTVGSGASHRTRRSGTRCARAAAPDCRLLEGTLRATRR